MLSFAKRILSEYMKRQTFFIVSLLIASFLCVSLPCKATMDFDYLRRTYGNQSDKQKEEVWKSVKVYLKQLDETLADTAQYKAQKLARIRRIERQLAATRAPHARYALFMKLENEYSIVNFPKAFYMALQARKEAQRWGDRQAYYSAQLRMSSLLIKGGYFKECSEILNGIVKTDLSKPNLFRYYKSVFDMNFEDGFIFPCKRDAGDPYSQAMRAVYKEACRDFPDSTYEQTRMKMEYNFHLLRYKEACKYALQLVASGRPGTEEYAYQLGNVGYNMMGSGEFVDAVKYLTSSAIEEIKLGSSEYPVMRKLTELLSVMGRSREAFHYSNVGMKNARDYQSMYRIYEVSQFYPLVHDQMFTTIHRQRNLLIGSVVALVLFAILIVFGFFWIKKQNANLQRQNTIISKMNRQLSEANKIKISVLGSVISNMSLRKNIANEFFMKLNRLLTVGNYSEARELTQKRPSRDKAQNELLDKIILSVFPQFVTQFYALLRPECRPASPAIDKLTPEMRLFGLIRLGITNNAQLAESLNYSLNTIKHYKTIVFNNSDYTNEDFYKHLMEIHYEISDDKEGVQRSV